jgi:hypothetical protein
MFLQQYGVFPELNIMYIQVNYADKSSENVTFASILTDQQSPIVDVPVDQTTVIPSLQPTLVSKPVLKEAKVSVEAPVATDTKADKERRRQVDSKSAVRQSVKYKLQNKIAGIDNPTPGNEIPTLSEAIKIAGAELSTPIKITEGEITHVVFDQEESMFRFTYKGNQFAAFYVANARGKIRWEIAKLDDKSGTYKSVSLDELKNINEKYGSQKDLLLSLGAKNLVEDIENFEKVEYSKEDKSSGNGIIPLENTVSAEQVRLGKKYGVTYTLEDFLKQYDAELAASEGKPETKIEKKVEEKKEEDYNPLAASLTPEQINQGKKNKEGCVGVGKKKKEV